VVEEEPFRVEPLAQAVQVAVETLEQAVEIIQVQAEPQTQVAAVERLLIKLQSFYLVLAALALSSSRPINNEDKWKLKSIGCMESTPQCTC
jgi:hypothetical protein